jgi:hypothetical protein
MKPCRNIIALTVAAVFCCCPILHAGTGQTPAGGEGPAPPAGNDGPITVQKKLEKIETNLNTTIDKLNETIKALNKTVEGIGIESKKINERIDRRKDETTNLLLKFNDLSVRLERLEKSLKSSIAALPPGTNSTDVPAGIGTDGPGAGATGADLAYRVNRLERRLDKLSREVMELRQKSSTAFYPPNGSLEEIKLRLDQMARDLNALRSGPHVAGSSPAATVPATTGRLQLVNRSLEEMLFIVNGNSYRVAPASTRVVEGHPAGTITHEVVSSFRGSAGQRVSNLPANFTLTLTAE